MPPLAGFARHTSSLIGATLLTSLAFQNLIYRRASTSERDRLTAHKTILESLVQRLRAGENVPQDEIVRLVRLARGYDVGDATARVEDTTWREVVFGKRVEEAGERVQEQRVVDEWNAALFDEETKPKVQPATTPVSPVPIATPHTPSSAPAKKPLFL